MASMKAARPKAQRFLGFGRADSNREFLETETRCSGITLPAHLTPPLLTEYLSTFWLQDVQTQPPSLVKTVSGV
jgi:hypothetical protein